MILLPAVRRSAAVLFATLALLVSSACSDEGSGDAAAPSDAPSASPSGSGDPRSPEALAASLSFEAPPANDPAVEAALDGYEDFLRQFIVAQGLAQPEHPPLLARIDPTDPAFPERVLGNMRADDAAGRYVLGAFHERVLDTSKINAEGVVIDTCTDYRERQFYAKDTGELQGPIDASLVRAEVVMTEVEDRWVVSQYAVAQQQDCA